MTDQQARTSDNAGNTSKLSIVLASVVIGQFLWNVLVPAHEYPMRDEQVLTMVLNFLLVAGVVGQRKFMSRPLFWITLLAGIGLFALRLLSDHGWWTGHLFYSLELGR